MFSILQRSIFGELIRAFLMSLVALTGILLIAGIVAEAAQRGLGPSQILAAIPLIIPSTLPYTIPSTTLFATCLVYGRLSHDNEVIAIKAAGVSLWKIVSPAIILGVFTTIVTMVLYCNLIPNTQYTLRAQFLKDVEEFLYSMLKADRAINHPRLGYAIWVRQVQGHRLLDATFKHRDATGGYEWVAHAREAELLVDMPHNQLLMHMRHGIVHTVKSGDNGYFEDKVWEVPMPDSPLGFERARKYREMTWNMLLQRLVDEKEALIKAQADTAAALALEASGSYLKDLPLHLKNLRELRDQLTRNITFVRMELYMRPAIAFGCLCFVLVGCPVGIWFSKSDYLSAFITCFLPIVFLYYPLLLTGINLSRNGHFHPIFGMMACNAIMIVIALNLLRRLMRN